MSEKKEGNRMNYLLVPLAAATLVGFGAFFVTGMPADDTVPVSKANTAQAASSTVKTPVVMTPEEKMKLIKNDEVKGAAVPTESAQAVSVVVDSGFFPNVIEAKKGMPLTMTFVWKGTAANKDMKVVFPSLGTLMVVVPKNGKVTMVVPMPKEAGQTVNFSCGMKLLKGRIVTVD